MSYELLKPAILVGVGVHRRGGVRYTRTELERATEGEGERKRWETEKVVVNTAELAEADKAAGRIRRQLVKNQLCTRTSFGFLCDLEREGELDAVMRSMRQDAAMVSQGLLSCSLSVTFVKGRIAANDEQAVLALTAEIGSVLEKLTSAIQQADVKKIRAVLQDARGLENLLAEKPKSEALAAAFAAARAAAKTIRKEVEKKGKTKAAAADSIDLAPISGTRMLFLEYEQAAEIGVSAAPVVSGRRFQSAVNE